MRARQGFFPVGWWLLATACATAPVPSVPVATMPEVNVVEYASLLRMADSRRLDTGVVDAGLASMHRAVRIYAARAIGQLGPVRAAGRVERLRGLLRDDDAAVAAQAAYSLGLLRDSGSTVELARALAREPAVAREAAWALGQIGANARATVVAALASAPADPGTRIQLLLAAAKLSPVPAPAVIAYFSDGHPSVVWAAAYAISRTRTAAGLSALLSLADSTVAARPGAAAPATTAPYVGPGSAPHRIRAEVARAVPRSATGDSLGARALAVLERLVRDDYPHVRINALRSLGSYGAVARRLVIPAVRDSDPNVRVAAVQSIATVADSSPPEWGALWLLDTAFVFRQALVESAMRFGVELPEASGWAADTSWRRRAAIASAAGRSPAAEQRIRVARPFLSDADPRVRAAAIAGIAPDTASLDAEIRGLLSAATSDSDPLVRARAVSRLSGRPEEERDPPTPVHELAWYEDVVRTIVAPALGGAPPRAVLATEHGPIELELFGADAPLTVKNFLDLARAGTYRGTRFHRVVPNFVVQDGDPRGDGSGGPGYSIRDELNPRRYERGVLGMALSGPDTGGSQWFITHSPQPHLDGGYTVFGRVTSGFGALDRIVQGDLVLGIR